MARFEEFLHVTKAGTPIIHTKERLYNDDVYCCEDDNKCCFVDCSQRGRGRSILFNRIFCSKEHYDLFCLSTYLALKANTGLPEGYD